MEIRDVFVLKKAIERRRCDALSSHLGELRLIEKIGDKQPPKCY